MGKRRASKLKLQLPVEDEETESESEVKREYVGGRDSSSFERSSSSSEADSDSETERPRKKTIRKSSSSASSSDSNSSSSDEDSELEEKILDDSNDSVKIETEEGDAEAESNSEEAPGSDTDSENDWETQLESEVTEGDDKPRKKKDEVVEVNDNDSDAEWREDEWEDQDIPTDDENDEEFSNGDVQQAKYVMRNIISRVPLIEVTAIRRGVKLSGPPLEFATTHLDEHARKFRWPQHIRNLRNTNFSQDPTEILEDFELLPETKQPDAESPVASHLLRRNDQDVPQESAFAQVPRPVVALAAEALRRSSRKRKRTAGSENDEEPSAFPSAPALLNFARIGGQFGDHFVESLLSANGKALQGIDSEYDIDIDKRCWSSLPTKKKPIANWRFVLEHVRRTMGRSEGLYDAVCPPMKQETLERITNRLKKLYGHTTQHEKNDIFERRTPTSNNSAEATPKRSESAW